MRSTRSWLSVLVLPSIVLLGLILSSCVRVTASAPVSLQGTPAPTRAAQAHASTSRENVTAPRPQHGGGELRTYVTSDPIGFHPYLASDAASYAFSRLVYSGDLLRLDEKTLEYVPNMAESYSISPDGLTFTFHLRKDMLWSDGTPLTAQDWKWTFDKVVNPQTRVPACTVSKCPDLPPLNITFSDGNQISSYEALDDYTLRVVTTKVYAPALGQVSALITPLPKHVWQGQPWADPLINREILHPSVVSGPYKLVEWKRTESATFEANDKYWNRGAPSIRRRVIEIVPDDEVGFQKLKSGEIDAGPIPAGRLDEALDLPNVTVYSWWPAAAAWSYVGLNTRQGFPTSDINVRHGLSYAIDKQALTDRIMQGRARRQCSIYPDASWVFTPDVPCYDYDPKTAVAEFAKSGYRLSHGKMLDKAGQQLTLKLLYGPDTSVERKSTATMVAGYLNQIGIETQVRGLTWDDLQQAVHSDKPDWDLYIGAWQNALEPQSNAPIADAQAIPALNTVGYINTDVNDLFAQAGATYDASLRKLKYQEIQKLIARDAPYIFLFYQKAWYGVSDRIQGIAPTALGIDWNADDWYATGATREARDGDGRNAYQR